ncbi:MAG TPA: SAM-dependent methyltransferase [Peptococcaceae bacterium]|nr:SAM-dependent methyltransferase [Peptococcaceae bacterium]
MKIPERLARIADYVPRGFVAADVGTDHALLPVYLVKEGICPRVVATDLHAGPLEVARSSVSASGTGGKVEIRQGDGLKVLQPGEVNLVIIAGMGGKRMINILESSPEVLKHLQRLILQPNEDAPELRKWLLDHYWFLIDEDLVREKGRYYEIIVAEPRSDQRENDLLSQLAPVLGIENGPEVLLEIGPCLLQKKHPLLSGFLKEKIDKLEKIVASLEKAQGLGARRKQQELREKVNCIRKVFRLLLF